MKTPISDFVNKYAEKNTLRFHMPGHKGKGALGCEAYDITEIEGADVLYSCKGIIKESEDNTSSLFGTAHSYFSTEGSTLCIKAMLALATQGKEKPFILAQRNVHKAFCYAAALLDIDVEFIYSDQYHLCSCEIDAEIVEKAIEACDTRPDAVYITSPDYLGYIPDIGAIAGVCKKKGIPLLCDNAHGAYLKFLSPSRHPIDLGATMCCDSAHKTLPVLTGGAYLHVSKDAPEEYNENARRMLSLFASTSPSYLILRSLDLCNKYLAEDFTKRLGECVVKVRNCKQRLGKLGYNIKESEELKIVIEADKADELSTYLRENNIECEFSDESCLVLMISTQNSDEDIEALVSALEAYEGVRGCCRDKEELCFRAERVMSIRKALLCKSKNIPIEEASGRVCADPTVSCPPAVPIVLSGEMITEDAVKLFKKYGIESVSVVK